ncbi:hypothetical protein ACF1E9_16840 [Streptomyces roseolus]
MGAGRGAGCADAWQEGYSDEAECENGEKEDRDEDAYPVAWARAR